MRLLFGAASGFPVAVLFGRLVFQFLFPFGEIGFVDTIFNQPPLDTDKAVGAFGTETADLFPGFDANNLFVVGPHQKEFPTPMSADMRTDTFYGDLLSDQCFCLGEDSVDFGDFCRRRFSLGCLLVAGVPSAAGRENQRRREHSC